MAAKKKTLGEWIREVATSKIPSRFNLTQFKEQKEKYIVHKNICENIIKIHEETKCPIGYILYAIGKDYHKMVVFKQMYTKFDENRVRAVIDMAKAFAEHCAMKCYTDRMFHACDKIYSQHTTDVEEFKWVLEHNLDKGKKKFASVKDIMCQLGYENN